MIEPVSEPRAWKRPVILSCPVDAVRLEDAVTWVDARIQERRPVRVGAVNAAKLVKMDKDPALAKAVSSCELVIPDGMGVVWASSVLSRVRLRRVAGIDLMEALVASAAERGHRIYFLGARPEVLEAMLNRFRERFPQLQVAGSHHGYFHAEEEPALVGEIRESGADLLFVAMSTPAKEFWIDRNYQATGVPVSMGVGGSFDVFAGLVQRAPRWMQDSGLEWLYRVLQEPGRLWRRYLSTNAVFIGSVLARACKRPFERRNP
jgi:N-acetylglucosaminyldiphosphoundecaprenol N-acetyl-beta-D-mannosaminyltransferase